MRQHPSIKRFLALATLLVFTISISPKTFFHDVLATHQDQAFCDHPAKTSACIHKKGFDCGFDNLVVTTPFLEQQTQTGILFIRHYAGVLPDSIKFFTPEFFLQRAGRGPPSI